MLCSTKASQCWRGSSWEGASGEAADWPVAPVCNWWKSPVPSPGMVSALVPLCYMSCVPHWVCVAMSIIQLLVLGRPHEPVKMLSSGETWVLMKAGVQEEECAPLWYTHTHTHFKIPNMFIMAICNLMLIILLLLRYKKVWFVYICVWDMIILVCYLPVYVFTCLLFVHFTVSTFICIAFSRPQDNAF